MKAYPIKFSPILKEKIWGGNKLKYVLKKNSDHQNIGESWEVSGVKDNVSVVSNGIYANASLTDLIEAYKSEFLGSSNIDRFGMEFPLLIKFLDANKPLSVQVHPDDEMAKKHHNSFGKTEMWYVMDHEPDAEIILGLKEGNSKKIDLESVNQNNVYSIFNAIKVDKGNSYFIPAGQVHAIGAGVMIAEIQQTSDLTYRVYDWDRRDKEGNTRDLHLDLAQKACKLSNDFKSKNAYNGSNQDRNLVDCEFFTTNEVSISGNLNRKLSSIDSFVIYMCVDGTAEVMVDGNSETLNTGETILIPACAKHIEFQSREAKVLEVYVKPLLNLNKVNKRAS